MKDEIQVYVNARIEYYEEQAVKTSNAVLQSAYIAMVAELEQLAQFIDGVS